MNARRIFSSLILCTVLLLTAASAQAQTGEQKRRLLEQAAAGGRTLPTANETSTEELAAPALSQQDGILGILGAEKKNLIAGSWIGDVTITTPPEFGGTFKALLSFTEDGRMFATAQGDVLAPVQSPGMGAWQYQGGRTNALSFKTLFYETQGAAAGSLIGVATIRSSSTINEASDKFSGPFKFALADPQGNVLLTTEGTWQFTRIKVEPLQ
jgi:hypothetical protein